MPTYLLHGFRWQRANIRIHIILQDLEDAAPDWIVAPATSVTLLNSFYSLYDFLPPSNPPPASYPLPIPAEKVIVEDANQGRRTLVKKKSGSMASLSALTKKGAGKPGSNGAAGTTEGNGQTHPSPHPYPQLRPGPDAPTTIKRPSQATTVPERVPTFNDWSVVKLVEAYDPTDLQSSTQKYAYVADHLVEVTLSVSISEQIAIYENKLREAEGILNLSPSTPSSPGTPGMAGVGSSGELNREGLGLSGMSARELRRKSRRLGWFEKLRDGLEKGADIGWFVVVCGDEERASPSLVRDTEDEEEEEEVEEPLKTPRSAGLKGFFGRRKNVPEE
jgi:hypothetical protein